MAHTFTNARVIKNNTQSKPEAPQAPTKPLTIPRPANHAEYQIAYKEGYRPTGGDVWAIPTPSTIPTGTQTYNRTSKHSAKTATKTVNKPDSIKTKPISRTLPSDAVKLAKNAKNNTRSNASNSDVTIEIMVNKVCVKTITISIK